MIKDNDNVKLEVVFEEYERFGGGGVKKAIIKGTYLEALKKMCDKMCLYIDSETIEEEGMNAEDIINEIESSNGDGCDYIFSLKDLISGELIVDGGDYDEEEW